MELRELEQLEAATVPGPWEVGSQWHYIYAYRWSSKLPIVGVRMRDEALFIAAARNTMPELLRLARAAKAWYDTSEALRAFVEDGRVSSTDDDMYAEFSSASEALAETIREIYL